MGNSLGQMLNTAANNPTAQAVALGAANGAAGTRNLEIRRIPKTGEGERKVKNCEDAFNLLQEILSRDHPEWSQNADDMLKKIGGDAEGGCGCEGGDEEYSGGYDEDYSGGGRRSRRSYFNGGAEADPTKSLREYEHSLSSKTKEEFIKRIATALAKVGVKVDPNDDPEVIVKSLRDNIPNPKNGKSFSDDANAQRKVCETVAKVFNDEFTPGATRHEDMFIDTSMSSPELCRAIAEWSQSFSHGVNTEFLNVHASVRNALRSVEILNEIMQESFDKIQKQIEADGNPELTRHTDKLHDLFKKAQSERRRQEALLKNILNIHLAPAAKELEIALRDESSSNAMIRRLGLKPGTSEFADSLAYSISGVGTTANIAHRVNKALKRVGISVNEYLNSPDQKAFSKLLDEHMYSLKTSDMTAVKNFLTSVEELNKNFKDKNNNEFKSALESAAATGGARDYHGGDYDEKGDYIYRSAIDKRVLQTKAEKRVVIRDFAKRISKHYDDILTAVKALGPELGGKIPLNDSTEQLKDTLVRLMDMRQNKMELSLIGLYAQADSRAKKEQFINRLRQVSMACAHLMTLETFKSSSNLIAGLKSAIDSLEKTVDFYSDVITKKFGGVEFDMDDMYQGGTAPVRGGANEDLVPEIARSSITLNEAVSEFAYFYYVANIRENLKRSSEELDVFGEKYVDLLGDAVAMRLWHLKQERANELAKLPTAAERADAAKNWQHVFPTGADGDKKLKLAEDWIKQEFDVKEKFYKALQAMDLYMKAFTSGIVNDPDAARDIKKILDGTQVIARWFDEETGNHLSSAFEQMDTVNYAKPPFVRANTREVSKHILGNNDANHYYDKTKVAMAAHVNSLPGYPFAGAPFDEAEADNRPKFAKKHVSDTIDHFQALKNLVNAFSRIGDNFGGKEIKTQIFMSPSQIYKYLIDFLKMSSLSMVKRAAVGDDAEDVPFATMDPNGVVANGTYYSVTNQRAQFRVNFSAIDHRTAPDINNRFNNYTIENRYFILILKAMAAKIMTTIGVYDMFERKTPLYELTPTRLIIGGGFDDVEIIEGAAELYFRLPRLVEFYKMIFFKEKPTENDPDSIKIAMIPELEGVFSGLIRIIFLKATGANEGEYADSELRKMITEINAIYTHFKGSVGEDKCVKASMNALVKEINRRYAVIKNKDMHEYWNLIQREKGLAEGDYNRTDYAILPGEGDDITERMAPSDRFTSTLGTAVNAAIPGAVPREFNGRIQLNDNINDANSRRMLVRAFRSKIEGEFSKVKDNFGKTSYTQLINRSREKIKKAANLSEKTTAAMELINNSSVVGVDANRALMFHETVVVGLNTLMAVSNFITDFENALYDLDAEQIELAIQDTLHWSMGYRARRIIQLEGLIVQNNEMHNADPAVNIKSQRLEIGRRIRFILYTEYQQILKRRKHIDIDMLNISVYTGFNANRIRLAEDAQAANRMAFYPSVISDQNQAALDANKAINGHGVGYGNILLFSRLFMDYPKLMEEYIETLFNINQESGGMIEVKFMSGDNPTAIHINGSKLKDFIENTLNEVKYYMDMFRSSISKDVVERFEDIRNVGSIYWLEKNLIDGRLKGINDRNEDDQSKTLDFMFKKANTIFKYLTATNKVPLTNEAGADYINNVYIKTEHNVEIAKNALANTAEQTASRHESYGNSLASLLWYDSMLPSDQNNIQHELFPVSINRFIDRTVTASTKATIGQLQLINQTLFKRLLFNKRQGRAPYGDGDAPPSSHIFNITCDTSMDNSLTILNDDDVGRNLGHESVVTRHKSLLFMFNQLMYKYLLEFVDTSGDKIYSKLIDSYVNGSAAKSISSPSGSSFPDLIDEPGGRGDMLRINDPKQNIVLFESISWVLQRLSKDINPSNQVSDHLVSTLIDIPAYMKENYRVKLPNFVKQFNIILQKGEFIRQLIQKTKIDCYRIMPTVVNEVVNVVVAGEEPPPPQPHNYRKNMNFNGADNGLIDGRENALYSGFVNMTSDDMKTRVNEVIDSITSHAYTISTCANEVLREITDDPVYLQTQEKSIEMYKLRYGKLPLMPFSASLITLSGATNRERYNFMFPNKTIGSIDFKYQYGIRGILLQDEAITYDKIPGTQMIVQNYNNSSTKREQIDTDRYLKFIQTLTAGIRYLVNTTCFKTGQSLYSTSFGQLSYTNEYPGITPKREELRGRNLPVVVPGAYNNEVKNKMLPYTLSLTIRNGTVSGGRSTEIASFWNPPDIQKVISMVETSNQDDEIVKIIKYIDDKSGDNTRDKERILNLVDMNIIPINVHALMRDVPLANLYNYEYTFDQMIVSLYGEQMSKYFGDDGGPKSPELPGGPGSYKRTKEMFLKMMTDPYYNISPDQRNYYGSDVFELGSAGFIHRMFRGDNDLGLGRPKFLFDQLFNKSLFGNAYAGQNDYDEAGPGVGAGVRRGRNRIGETFIVSSGLIKIFNRFTLILREVINEFNILRNKLIELINESLTSGIRSTYPQLPEKWRTDADFYIQPIEANGGKPRFSASANSFLRDVNDGPQEQSRKLVRRLYQNLAEKVLSMVNFIYEIHHTHTQEIDQDHPKVSLPTDVYDRITETILDVDPGDNLVDITLVVLFKPVDRETTPRQNFEWKSPEILQKLILGSDRTRPATDTWQQVLFDLLNGSFGLNAADGSLGRKFGNMKAWLRFHKMFRDSLVNPNGALNLPGTQQVETIFNESTTLTYLDKPDAAVGADDHTAVKVVQVGSAVKRRQLEAIGRARFDTTLVRNLFFITNILRVVRLKLNRELTQSRNVIVKSHEAVAQGLTEYGADPFSPNEVYSSTLPGNVARYNDADNDY